jgi:hypothetical protein
MVGWQMNDKLEGILGGNSHGLIDVQLDVCLKELQKSMKNLIHGTFHGI